MEVDSGFISISLMLLYIPSVEVAWKEIQALSKDQTEKRGGYGDVDSMIMIIK